eukprot:scaffold13355_cov265-Alexandrium_tamarense.AAC.3
MCGGRWREVPGIFHAEASAWWAFASSRGNISVNPPPFSCHTMTSADEEGTSSWLDSLTTPLNACSLETYTPIAQQPDGSETIVPLVIGCYQLNEPTTEETSTDADAE